ncbi:MAG: NAD(P)(+) transhydrogenase (Re/Si-specific) subunit alpha [Verrucomicrobiaceae bacterium]|nr:NAD(P)(+) transhydrogenase (Re/Si-specific) subunit alpha [Verrucomicrobiaceae bacterium]|tara:strand:- start:1821 stop:2951 length:1131 start_codon:yes stop_codon:yes gene_type:complete
MILFAPKEIDSRETRAAITPSTAKRLVDKGIDVQVEKGIGELSGYKDQEYLDAGAQVVNDRLDALSRSEIVFRVRKPSIEEIELTKEGCIHLSFLDPFNDPESLNAMASNGITGVSLEMIPRTTLAQKMDALSSQANIAGYTSVIYAAEKLDKVLPMMMTPAGTISPAKFFVIGIGVAGLQAIATAKRLGARVTAFDVRQEALEQAESLGAKALRIDLGGESNGGGQVYAKELTQDQLEKQREAQAKVCEDSDVVITTAKVFGRKSPILLKKDVIDRMKNGSLIVDLAAESGGNVEGTVVDEEVVTENGVRIVGLSNFEGMAAYHSSQVFSANLGSFIEHFWNDEEKVFNLDLDDEILSGCVLTNKGKIIHEKFIN